MKRRNKKMTSYIMIPIVYSILSLVCIFVLGAPLIRTCKETFVATVKQNTPSEIASEQVQDPKQEMGTSEEITPELGTSYGMLNCERVGLQAEIFYGDSEVEFQKGIGQYTNGAFPWNQGSVLLGGHDTTYFKSLIEIQKDDIVTVRTNQKEYQYQVDKIEIIEAESFDNSILESEDRLILYTCYPFGNILKDRTERYLVYCKRLF